MPENRNPFQCLPVIAFATALSERHGFRIVVVEAQ